MERLAMETKNLTDENIKKILEIFPNVATEAKDKFGNIKTAIDFEKLKQELSHNVIDGEESYDFTWVGKKEAMLEANRPIRKTLRPDRDSSVNWDTTENIYIEGDNLEVLKLLQESYLGKVKMIYIDPPYNTGNDFIYRDNFTIDKESYDGEIGVEDEEGYKLFKNNESNGRFHSDWCSMIYPRLKVAKNLLSDDGVIFISIGEEEIDNLIKICSSEFGEINKLGIISRVAKTASNKGTYFAPSIDYIVVYAKNSSCLQPFVGEVNTSLYKKIETEGERKGEQYRDDVALYQSALDPMRGCVNQRYYIQAPDGSLLIPPGDVFPDKKEDSAHIQPQTPRDKVWRWSYLSYMQNKHLLVFKETTTSPLLDENGKQAKYNIYTKSYLSDRKENGTLPRNLWENFINRKGADLLKKMGIPFDFSKPIELLEYIFKISGIKGNELVLDFFSGSATTAHALMKYNSENNSNCKFIMIQLPEKIVEKSEAYNAGYKNICEIGKERIRKAGKKIQEENPDKKLDIGFRVFKVDDTNMKDVYYSPQEFKQDQLGLFESNIKDDRTDEDLLYEVLLNSGVELSLPHKVETIDGMRVHFIQSEYSSTPDLIACFEAKVPETLVRTIAQYKPTKVVFRDSCFRGDSNKINIEEMFKLITPDTRVKVL